MSQVVIMKPFGAVARLVRPVPQFRCELPEGQQRKAPASSLISLSLSLSLSLSVCVCLSVCLSVCERLL
jgi:hypothetical protein